MRYPPLSVSDVTALHPALAKDYTFISSWSSACPDFAIPRLADGEVKFKRVPEQDDELRPGTEVEHVGKAFIMQWTYDWLEVATVADD